MEKNTCTHCNSDNKVDHKYCKSCGFELPKIEVQTVTEDRAKPAKKTPWITFAGIVVGIAVAVFAQQMVQRYVFASPAYDKQMVEMANAMNKSCPIFVDAETRLDNVLALPNNVFQYNYTMVNVEVGMVDTIELKRVMEPLILNTVKTNPQMQFIRDNKTTLNYSYKDKNAKYVCSISMPSQKYLK